MRKKMRMRKRKKEERKKGSTKQHFKISSGRSRLFICRGYFAFIRLSLQIDYPKNFNRDKNAVDFD
jgi:hypothetical protein